MKVIKRDGRIVKYNPDKVVCAIEKANVEVQATHRICSDEIQIILDYLKSLNKKRILVEDIQDIVEFKLMELQHYELAKKYIVYRYTRTLARKKQVNDQVILGLVHGYNDNKTQKSIRRITDQRELIMAGISRDLS